MRIRVGVAAFALTMVWLPLIVCAQPTPVSRKAPAPEARCDINRATMEQLLTVPGMTRSWAGRIVRFRPYRTKVDLLERGVVPGEVYERIKDYVIAHRDKQ
jgi:DNA uptake protein ComE-like DNA-binding protein